MRVLSCGREDSRIDSAGRSSRNRSLYLISIVVDIYRAVFKTFYGCTLVEQCHWFYLTFRKYLLSPLLLSHLANSWVYGCVNFRNVYKGTWTQYYFFGPHNVRQLSNVRFLIEIEMNMSKMIKKIGIRLGQLLKFVKDLIILTIV